MPLIRQVICPGGGAYFSCDQEYVRSMVPDAAKGTFAALSSLAKGEAVALGEAAA